MTPLRHTAWLSRHPAHADDALHTLADALPHPTALDALIHAIEHPVLERHARFAAHTLARTSKTTPAHVLQTTLTHPSGPIRLSTLRGLHHTHAAIPSLPRIITHDPSPLLRQTAIGFAAERALYPDIADALSDPVWRARRQAIQHLANAITDTPELRAGLDDWLPTPISHITRAALAFLDATLQGTLTEPHEDPAGPPQPDAPWWSPDPALLLENLSTLTHHDLLARPDALHALVRLQDGYPLDACLRRIRERALEALEAGATPELLEALAQDFAEPRLPYLSETLHALFGRLSGERLRALDWSAALAAPRPTLKAAALRYAPESAARRACAMEAASDVHTGLRQAALDALSPADDAEAVLDTHGSAPTPELIAWLRADDDARSLSWMLRHVEHPDPTIRRAVATALPEAEAGRLLDDGDASVREAALRPRSAAKLLEEPDTESSWRVLFRAAKLLGRDINTLAPAELPRINASTAEVRLRTGPWWRPGGTSSLRLRTVTEDSPRIASLRTLKTAPEPLEVSPLILSGRYGLDQEGFAYAWERGLQTFFWEPEYGAESLFLRNLPAHLKARTRVVAGSFRAHPRDVRDDLHAALRQLGRERIEVFILFWVRDRERLRDDILEVLVEAQLRGQIATFGFSTHDRGIAAEAQERGDWPVLMLRHSAAHRAAEEQLLPSASQHDILTFTALCYGRMLRARDGHAAPFTPADCYRYSLSQPNVTATMTAPRNLRELRHNLEVLERPEIEPELAQAMRAFVSDERAQSRTFKRLITGV